MLRLTRLALTDFRNYPSLVWLPQTRISVLLGANGTGKTNLLEAISLLVPGRGLRGARNDALARQGGTGRWGAAGKFMAGLDETEVGTGVTPENPDRRAFLRDGAAVKSHEAAAAQIAMLWLTPQMDRLFLDGASGRRSFLDRLVYALEPSHARQIAAHDRAVASRNRLLAQGRYDVSWLTGLEDEVARHAVSVAALRADIAARLNLALATDAAGGFPAAEMSVRCEIGDRLSQGPALAVEQWVRDELRARREADQAAGRTSVGAHRADMDLRDRATGVAAAHASTGQQKSLLVGVVLGHAALIEAGRGIAPILLLDEAAAHLDADRRAALVAAIGRLTCQVMLTGTDRAAYAGLTQETGWFEVAANTIRPGRESECGV